MNQLSPVQIDKIKNAAKEIDMLSREQDLVFENLSAELEINEEHDAYHWLFDLCYNGEGIDFELYLKKIDLLLSGKKDK